MKYVFLAALYFGLGYSLPSFPFMIGLILSILILLITGVFLFYRISTYLERIL